MILREKPSFAIMPHVLRLRLTDAKSSHRDPAERQLTIANTQKTTDKGQEPRGSLSRTTTWGIGVLAAITKGPTRQGSSHKDLSSIWLLRNAVEGQSLRRTTFWEPLRVDFLGSRLSSCVVRLVSYHAIPCLPPVLHRKPRYHTDAPYVHTTLYHTFLVHYTTQKTTAHSHHTAPHLITALFWPENHCTRLSLYDLPHLPTALFYTSYFYTTQHHIWNTSPEKFHDEHIQHPPPCLWIRRKKERYHVDKRISMR